MPVLGFVKINSWIKMNGPPVHPRQCTNAKLVLILLASIARHQYDNYYFIKTSIPVVLVIFQMSFQLNSRDEIAMIIFQ